MARRIKRTSVKRLASLSALGAGALAVAPGVAQAGIVVVNISPIQVGWSVGSPSAGFALPGAGGISFFRTSTGCGPSCTVYLLGAQINSIGAQALFNPAFLTAAQKSNFAGPFTTTFARLPAFRQRSRFYSTTTTPFTGAPAFQLKAAPQGFVTTSTHGGDGTRYLSFQFVPDGVNVQHGWVKLDMSFTPPDAPGWGGPNLSIDQFAYTTTDVEGVPEPSTLDLSGLSALVLGAAGLRRWRATRKKAA